MPWPPSITPPPSAPPVSAGQRASDASAPSPALFSAEPSSAWPCPSRRTSSSSRSPASSAPSPSPSSTCQRQPKTRPRTHHTPTFLPPPLLLHTLKGPHHAHPAPHRQHRPRRRRLPEVHLG